MWYFATAGRGTEKFLLNEVQHNLQSRRSYMVDGKVFFETEEVAEQVLTLKTAERIFVSICYNKRLNLRCKQDIYRIKTFIRTTQHWDEAVEAWKAFHTLIDDRKSENVCRPLHSESASEDEPKKKKLCATKECNDKRNEIEFRISCKCSGLAAQVTSPWQLSQEVSKVLVKKLGWKVNLKQPKMEVYLQVNKEGVILGLTLTRYPLSSRPYLKFIGLRTPVAWIMASLAQIKPGNLVLDPMCGAVTLLQEASQTWKEAVYLGCDNKIEALNKASENIMHSHQNGYSSNISLLHACVTALPLPSEAVEVVLCDTPFGMKHGDVEQVKAVYKPMIKELNRVLKPGGRVVLLTSKELKPSLLVSVKQATEQICHRNDQSITHLMHTEENSSVSDSTLSQESYKEICKSCSEKAQHNRLPHEHVSSDLNSQEHHKSDNLKHSFDDSSIKHVKDTKWSEIPADQMKSTRRTECNADPVLISGCDQKDMTVSHFSGNERSEIGDGIPDKSLRLNPAKSALISVESPITICKSPVTCSVSQKTNQPSIYQDGRLCNQCTSTWNLTGSHYVKLGETHAYICVFQKKRPL